MDGSQHGQAFPRTFAGHLARAGTGRAPAAIPVRDHEAQPPPQPLPEREWGLSAGQVVVAVVTIVALCQALGALYR